MARFSSELQQINHRAGNISKIYSFQTSTLQNYYLICDVKLILKLIIEQDREEPRWEQCMATLTGSLGIGLSSLYVKHHFKAESKNSVNNNENHLSSLKN